MNRYDILLGKPAPVLDSVTLEPVTMKRPHRTKAQILEDQKAAEYAQRMLNNGGFIRIPREEWPIVVHPAPAPRSVKLSGKQLLILQEYHTAEETEL